MNLPFAEAVEEQLGGIRKDGLYRQLRQFDSPSGPALHLGGVRLLNFASNDYLGLANEPSLKEAAIRAVERWGVGAGASRLICGSQTPHHQLEQALAAFKGTEAALAFASGYATALGTLGALLDKDDVVVLDKLVHACVVDAARLCGAKLRVFAHNDLNDLEDILRWADQRPAPASPQATRRRPRVLIVTESVFSMDGDQAPLRELVRLKDQYGAWLMVDEAHATGVFGTQRRGVAEALGVADRIEIQMGTLGKALGTAGGFISGSRGLIDVLINRARSFIFSTAPPPAWAAAAQASLRFVQSPEGAARCAQLWTNVTTLRQRLPNGPWRRLACESPILPLVLGEERRAVELADALRTLGVFVPAIRYPAVARGQARLRLTVTASHSATDLATLCQALEGKS